MAKEGKDMEKKLSARNGCSVQDSKAKDNGKVHGNKHQRFHAKRREVPSVEGGASNRRPQLASKTRSFDKRDQGRNNWNGRRDEMTKAQRAEFGSALGQGSKKMNLNHLLNFTMTPRGTQHESRASGQHGSWKSRNRWNGHRSSRYNKEQFLQANCQFVVRSGEDYSTHMMDGDTIVDWELVEQVRLYSHEMPSCPICLYPPCAAKITRCGHIYCWSCILHYIALSDKAWSKCPICYDAVSIKDLKSVLAKERYLYQSGDEITMCLMRRQRGSVIAQPVRVGDDLEEMNEPYTVSESAEKTRYVKLLTASTKEITNVILKTERMNLEKQLNENVDELEATFITEAMNQLKERERKVSGDLKADSSMDEAKSLTVCESTNENTDEDLDVFVAPPINEEDVLVYSSAFSDEEEVPEDGGGPPQEVLDVLKEEDLESEDAAQATEVTNLTSSMKLETASSLGSVSSENELEAPPDTSEMSARPTTASSSESRKHTYYFYQAEDGQHLYAHPLNVRSLIMEYGSLAKCPLTVTAKIVETEHMTINEDVRHRLRYITHLPLTCHFGVCELDLKPPLVSKEILDKFKDAFQRRKKTREKKQRDEKKRERKIKVEEEKLYGRYTITPSAFFEDSVTVSSGSAASSPSFSSPLSTSVEEDSHLDPRMYEQAQSSQPFQDSWGARPKTSQPQVPSFAQMLREGQAKRSPPKPLVSSSLKSFEKPKGKKSSEMDDSEASDEDYIPVPQYNQVFSDAIQDALDRAAIQMAEQKQAGNSEEKPGNRRGRKGRKKQQLLFSTAGPRFK